MQKIDIDKLRDNLPQYPGILGKEEYFNSAVLIPLVKFNNEYHLLFEKRAEHIRQGGEICFPGGEIDPEIDDSSIAAALRETAEEIGIPENKINVLGSFDTLFGPRQITVDSCVGELLIDSLDECLADKKEVDKIFTVPLAYFINNNPEVYTAESELNYSFYNNEGKKEELIPSRRNSTKGKVDKGYTKTRRKVLVYKVNGEVIWGITARLVYELVQKLESISEG